MSDGASLSNKSGFDQNASTVNNGDNWSGQNAATSESGKKPNATLGAGYNRRHGDEEIITHSGISAATITIADSAGQHAKTGQSADEAIEGIRPLRRRRRWQTQQEL